MQYWGLLFEILVVISAAFLLGSIAELLKQNAIIGYLLAGMLVGPFGLGIIHSASNINAIAELGVALLLFSIGLEFSFNRLKSIGLAAVGGGMLQISVTLAVGMGVSLLVGLDWRISVFFGSMLALSSTASVLRLLGDRAALDSVYGRNTLGVLLLQDTAVVPLTFILSLAAQKNGVDIPYQKVPMIALAALAVVCGFYLVFGQAIPRLLHLSPWGRNRELPILLAGIVAIGSATVAHEAGISPALGAFVAGLLIASTPYAVQVRADISPLRATLVTLFFASIGMLGDPILAARFWYWIMALAVGVVAVKTIVTWGAMRLIGVSCGMSLATALCLAQIGEFSFVLAEIGRGGIIGDHVFRLFIAVTILTLLFTPYLIMLAPGLAGLVERKLGRARKPAGDPIPEGDGCLIIVVGFGPSGEKVVQALYDKHSSNIVVIEMNKDSARKAERFGVRVQRADSTSPVVLEHAGIRNARIVVITVPDPRTAERVIHLCRDLNPDVRIISRARYHKFAGELLTAGAEIVVDEENQVGMRIASEVLGLLEKDENL